MFIPWSIPAATFFTLGIILAKFDLPWWSTMVWVLCFSLPLLRFKYLHLIALLSLLIPLGFGRYTYWQSQTNPLKDKIGQEVTLSGKSDGRHLYIDDPKTKVVLSPFDKIGSGNATLKGWLINPSSKRNPGGFDYQGYLRRRNIYAQLLITEVVNYEPKITFKERLRRGVVVGLGERSAALMQAMTLGIRDDLGDLREIFAASGLAHILALSGLHVGILITALGFAFMPLGRLRYPLLIFLVLGFMFLVGATPSVVRASLMVTAALLSLWVGSGRIEAWPALFLAGLLTLLWNPSLVFDLSFQLSYLAVAGILLLVNPLTQFFLGGGVLELKWWHWKNFVIISMIVSSSAQALSLPLVLSNFGSLPLLSPLVNVLAIPIATLLVPLGFLAAIFGLISLNLAKIINLFTAFFAYLLMRIAELGASLPSLSWGEISPIGYAFYGIGVIGIILWANRLLVLWRTLIIVCVAISCSMISNTETRPPELIYLDVGQGDSALIRLPKRIEILMDGGGTPFSKFDVGARTVVPALRALGVDELELVIASHPDTDHIEGLVSVLELIPVQKLIIGIPKEGKFLFDNLMAAAKKNHVPVLEVRRGESLHIKGARLDFLNPPHHPYETDNDNSVAFVLTIYGKPNTKALFLGDSSFEVEKDVAFPDIDILMAGHHGSPHSTSEELLLAAQPETAILSYGRNNYGHPSSEVIAKLKAHGVDILSTHEHGAVRIPLRPQ